MEAAATQIQKKLGPVYQVVANAGITHDNFFIKLKPDDWMQ
jgi:acetoacetyl-CoA reductase/3-oxoacyl-[acyl-carrier protein] reductase